MRNRVVRILFTLLVVGVVLGLAVPAISVTKDEVDAACEESARALATFEAAQATFDAAAAAYNESNSRLEAVSFQELGMRAEIEVHEDELATTRHAVIERAVQLYMAGGARSTDILLLSDNVETFLTGRTFLESATDEDIAAVARLDVLAAEAEELRTGLKAAQEELADLRASAEAFQKEMAAALIEGQNSYQELSGECTRLLAEYEQQLAREAAARAAAAKGAAGGLPAEATPGFICPMGEPISFINDWGFPRTGGRTHQGTDIFSPYGHPQVAVANGIVELRSGGLGGTALWVKSDYGVQYYYAHLSGYASGLKNGQQVTIGQVIGYTGDSGNARGGAPHLHFGIRPVQGGWVNPYPTLARNC